MSLVDQRPQLEIAPKSRRLGTAKAVADRLDVDTSTVYDLARKQILPGTVRVGRSVRFDLDALEAWIAAGGEALPGGWRQEAAK